MPPPTRDLKAEQLQKLRVNEKTVLESISTYEDKIHWAEEGLRSEGVSDDQRAAHRATLQDAKERVADERRKLQDIRNDIERISAP